MSRRYAGKSSEQIQEHLEYKALAQGIDKAKRGDPRWYQRYLSAQSKMEHDLKKDARLLTPADRELAHRNRDSVRRILKEKGIVWSHG